MTIGTYALFIPFLPLFAFVVTILFGGTPFCKKRAHRLPILAVAGSFVLSVLVLCDVIAGKTLNMDLYTWIKAGDFVVSIGFLIDPLTSVMLIVVTTVSLLVHIYSVGYMHDDPGYHRFFAYLGLFTFSMLMLVMANNFLQLYFGWEAVGLCSYFLIGFWYEKQSAADAAKKAFVVNRFGDFGFGLGVMLIFLLLGTLHYEPVFAKAAVLSARSLDIFGWEVNLATLVALLLFCGAVGKSAQLPLHVWLPDAMEGPTPVSALIHAATMVTAGVFLVARANPIFTLSPVAMSTVAVVGAVTALFAATIALVQTDIKRIIAYSTVSQLGYMFIACGVGAFGAGIFHLYTHAFFKALLFLGAGSVMHAMAGDTDIRNMGGLKKHLPYTYWTMLLASLSIAGIPGLAGFFSKDDILWRAFASGTSTGYFAWLLGCTAALLTAFYSFRIVYMTFHGTFRGGKELEHHLHESPPSMTVPLLVLAVGAVGAGYAGIPQVLGGHERIIEFLAPVVGHPHGHGSHAAEWGVMGLSVVLGVTGIGGAYYLYMMRPGLPEKMAGSLKPLYLLLLNKYYVDELYRRTIILPALWVSQYIVQKVMDSAIIEGIVNGVPAAIMRFGKQVRNVQTGVVLHYSIAMAVGLCLLGVAILARFLP